MRLIGEGTIENICREQSAQVLDGTTPNVYPREISRGDILLDEHSDLIRYTIKMHHDLMDRFIEDNHEIVKIGREKDTEAEKWRLDALRYISQKRTELRHMYPSRFSESLELIREGKFGEGLLHATKDGVLNAFPIDSTRKTKLLNGIENIINTSDSQNDFRKKETAFLLGYALSEHDSAMANHCKQVAHMTDHFVAYLLEKGYIDISRQESEDIVLGAFLHDVPGKIGVPKDILNYEGEFDSSKRIIMKSHTESGYENVKHIKGTIPGIVLDHHEKVDGTGYNRRKGDEEISLGARIVAIADAVQVISQGRAYQEARSIDEALAELKRCAGTQFDTNLVNYFIGATRTGAIPLEYKPDEIIYAKAGTNYKIGQEVRNHYTTRIRSSFKVLEGGLSRAS